MKCASSSGTEAADLELDLEEDDKEGGQVVCCCCWIATRAFAESVRASTASWRLVILLEKRRRRGECKWCCLYLKIRNKPVQDSSGVFTVSRVWQEEPLL